MNSPVPRFGPGSVQGRLDPEHLDTRHSPARSVLTSKRALIGSISTSTRAGVEPELLANRTGHHQVSLTWWCTRPRADRIPLLVEIEGNEKADQEAKSVAIEKNNPMVHPMILKSTRANEIHQAIEQEQQKQWVNRNETAAQLWNIKKRNTMIRKPERMKPSSQIYEWLSKRKHIAWIARLRTGHWSLNIYLKCFNIVYEPTFPECGDANETVKHFLLMCQKYERWRDRMRKAVGVGGMKVEKLLGDSWRIKDTIEFIESMERFEFWFRVFNALATEETFS